MQQHRVISLKAVTPLGTPRNSQLATITAGGRREKNPLFLEGLEEGPATTDSILHSMPV